MVDPKLGPEFRINTFTADTQDKPVIATDAAGNFVIAWESRNQDDSEEGVYARRYNNAGIPISNEFRVNTTTQLSQSNPDISADDSGNFVVVWDGAGNDPSRGAGAFRTGVFAQRYTSAGVPVGSETQINTTGGSGTIQTDAQVAKAPNGDYVVVWRSFDNNANADANSILGQRYNAQGVAQGSQFPIATSITNTQTDVTDVDIDANGNFVVTWADRDSANASSQTVLAQRFNNLGIAQGNRIVVATTTANVAFPAIDVDAAGNFVIAWQGNNGNILARRYNSFGIANGTALLVDFNGSNPDVALENDGEVIVTFTNAAGAISARRFSAANLPTGSAFQINTTRYTPFGSPQIALTPDGYIVTAPGQATDTDIFAQRLGNPTAPNPNPPSSGGVVLVGTAGRDRLRGTNNSDVISGLGGADILTGLGAGDILSGNGGNDTLRGNNGNDTLNGGLGRDSLFGGAGRDRFELGLRAGVDSVEDFRNGQDQLVLTGSLTFGQLRITQRGDDTLIRVGRTVIAELNDVRVAQITRADFVII